MAQACEYPHKNFSPIQTKWKVLRLYLKLLPQVYALVLLCKVCSDSCGRGELKFLIFRFLPLTSPLSPAPLILLPCHGLKGGKGGFGNMLRAIGAQVSVVKV